MASVSLSHIYKVYPNGLKAVNDFSMDIADREFIVFVGPSGCGKSTTLRMIAGLEDITAGELRIDGEVVNFTEPKDRDIAMVFQNYALYPHMTVFDNMAFGLQLRHYSKEQIRKRVNEAARILGITDYLSKKPKEMSGGQRQRVALGRAMVREPKVFLLDEPLSNLDAKLRTQMRSEILKLHERIKTTFIYVTHDQVEAMTMGTRIVVMKDGYVQQIDTPRNLYSYPENKFVAGFIGTPQMNFYSGRIKRDGDNVEITFDGADVKFTAPYKMFAKTDWMYMYGDKPVVFGIRSEHISVDPEKYPYSAKARVNYCEDLGVDSQVYADFDLSRKFDISEDTDGVENASESASAADEKSDGDDGLIESPTRAVIKAPAATVYDKGEIIEVSLDLSKMCIFDAQSEVSVLPRKPAFAAFDGVVKDGVLTVLGTEFAVPPAISLPDGEYIVEAAADALCFGGDIKVEVEESEKIADEELVRVVKGNNVFFVGAKAKIGKSIGLDLKLCNFYAKKSEQDIEDEAQAASETVAVVKPEEKKVNGFVKFMKKIFGRRKKKSVRVPSPPKTHVRSCPSYKLVHGAMNTENVLDCAFIRFKAPETVTEDGEQKTVSVNKYALKFVNPDIAAEETIDEASRSNDVKNDKTPVPTFEIDVDSDSAQKIMTGAGRLVYKDVLQIVFSPYEAVFADRGLNATVADIADYGTEKFCVLDVNGKTVLVKDDGAHSRGDAVKILPDISAAKIYDKTIDIRLV